MAKTVFTGPHKVLVAALVEARKAAGLTQAQVAARVGKDQSFMSLIEGSQRRVDVLEFYALAKAMGADPVELFKAVSAKLPETINI